MSVLQEMTKKKKLTVIMSLHELNMAERISNKILCVKGAYVEHFGTPVFRRLQREGIPFSTGILWENDQDVPAAKALSVNIIKVQAFHRIKPDIAELAKKEIDQCDKVICTLTDFGEWNKENEELLLYAKSRGKLCGTEKLWRN